jgi:hypothetical protein
MRHVSWMQVQSRPTLQARYLESGSQSASLNDLGIVRVMGEPAYDNGSYYVIDTTKDLVWAVLSTENVVMRTFDLSKYEAIEWADDLKAADERASL